MQKKIISLILVVNLFLMSFFSTIPAYAATSLDWTDFYMISETSDGMHKLEFKNDSAKENYIKLSSKEKKK